MQVKVKNPFLDFLWKSNAAVSLTAPPECPCAYVTGCEVPGSQQAITTHSGLCLWREAHPHNDNAEFVLWPVLSQLLVSVFPNLLIHSVLLQGWDLKQVTAMLRDARCITEGKRSTTRCIAGRRRNTDRFSQFFALRKLGDCQELCKKPEISAYVSRQTDS